MGYIMKRHCNILMSLLLLTINLSAQIVYDTIPDNEEFIGGHFWEETFIILDFENQALEYFKQVDFTQLDCYGGKVFVSTTFGRNGELKDTRILKAASPICDSIAFYFVNGLKDWLPGLLRGRFIDIPFVIPIKFDSLEIKNKYAKSNMFFSATEKEYNKRKDYFNFVFAEHYEQDIVSDFDWFKMFIAETFGNNQYVNILSNYRLRRKESIVLKIDNFKPRKTHLLVRDLSKDWILYEYNLRRNKIRIPRERDLFLIFYEEGTSPLIQTMMINAESDRIIDLNLEKYTKGRLINEIKKYSP